MHLQRPVVSMTSLHIYLTFNGNCRKAMEFYQECLGGKLDIQPLAGLPHTDRLPEKMQQSIINASLKREGLWIQASDMTGDTGLYAGNMVSLMLHCNNTTELQSCFRKLGKGGKIKQPVQRNVYGHLRGDLIDRFGIHWLLINYQPMEKTQKINTVDAYINAFQEPVRAKLEEMRQLISKAAPGAVEGIGYGMPGYKYLGRPLVYFAGYAGHIGFYATPTGHEAFKKELAGYKTGKDSVQFPLDKKLPAALIRRIVAFRLKENEALTTAKKQGRKPAAEKTAVKKKK